MRSILLTLALLAGACEHSDNAATDGGCMLPTSRNETATPSDPVSSNTINDLQDCAIGGKWGPLDKAIGAQSWALKTGTATLVNGFWVNTTPAAYEYSLDLPVGAELTSIVMGYNRNGTDSVTLSIFRRSILTGAAQNSRVIMTDATGAAYETATITDIDVLAGPESQTIEAGYAYWLHAEHLGAGDFAGAILTTRKL